MSINYMTTTDEAEAVIQKLRVAITVLQDAKTAMGELPTMAGVRCMGEALRNTELARQELLEEIATYK